MIDSVASNSSQTTSYGVESLVRVGARSPKQVVLRASETAKTSGQSGELSPEQLRQVNELAKRDREVRQHEQAHLAVGRDLIRGGPVYEYEVGPDNKRYAVSGEVTIDSTPGRTPEETIPKAEHIRETALAPAEPSVQDRSVAAKASRMEADARIELAIQDREASDQAGRAELYLGVQGTNGAGERLGATLDLFA